MSTEKWTVSNARHVLSQMDHKSRLSIYIHFIFLVKDFLYPEVLNIMIYNDENDTFFVTLKKIRHTRFVGQINSQKAAVSDNKIILDPCTRVYTQIACKAPLSGRGKNIHPLKLELKRLNSYPINGKAKIKCYKKIKYWPKNKH